MEDLEGTLPLFGAIGPDQVEVEPVSGDFVPEVGWAGEVLIDEKGKVEGSWIGRNFAYKPIVVKCGDMLLGKTLKVEVVEASQTYLKGKIVEQEADGELGYTVI